ncbi:MAG TPA: Rieske (2Fe-2S) protein [Capsulimonadaceae bacterium]|jgi:nitrite reductase (NADH) small subunit
MCFTAIHQAVRLVPVELIPLGEGREFEVNGRIVSVFRARNGAVYATQAECPHRKGPLADGIMGGSEIVCPFHGRRFDLATGKAISHDECGLETFPVRVDGDGVIVVTV